MVALEIEDIKGFTQRLFIGDTFDRFLLEEAQFVTFNTFDISGRIRKDYYSREEREEEKIGEYTAWSVIKPVCFSLIKGKRLPVSFKVVLRLSPSAAEHFLAERGILMPAEQVEGLFLNIRYEGQKLFCVTGTSLRLFTLDKTLEQQWDEAVERFIGVRRS